MTRALLPRRELEVALALSQRPRGARLAEIARACGMPLSSAQAAVRALRSRQIARASAGPRPAFQLERGPLVDALLALAVHALTSARAIELMLSANPAVEYAGRDANGYLVVLSTFAEPSDLVALERGLARAHVAGGPEVSLHEHDDLARRLVDDPTPLARARRARTIVGRVERSFRLPTVGRERGRALGRTHPGLPRVSKRAIHDLARRHGLRRVALFGSAVRSDLSPGSDVDVLIEPRPDTRLSLLDLASIRMRLEELYDRDVDVVTSGGLRPAMRQRIEREAVPLIG